ncbi:MAG: hypothetical protein KF718_15240 [Polyangiaceae bacterium]|nr:hypothetical protein [Polyangiaceae bacterium]
MSDNDDKNDASPGHEEQLITLLKEIRELIVDGNERQAQYIWLLFPIIAILLVQAILLATQ